MLWVFLSPYEIRDSRIIVCAGCRRVRKTSIGAAPWEVRSMAERAQLMGERLRLARGQREHVRVAAVGRSLIVHPDGCRSPWQVRG